MDCSQLRRKLVTHSVLKDGVITPQRQEWKTEPCGTPLFTETERKAGICRSCASGWTHEHNYAVTEEGS